MALSPGMRLGPYEVLATLGAGGMGQVYRARDTRLGRDVALKLMAEGAAQNGPDLTRFEQEARLAGSLNHPNVVVVFDVGVHEGSPYLVTELLHGETLRHRLERGRVPLETALDWAEQIARGLAAAHAQGVVHRDVKPDNIFITRAGHVKLLDFGIAKLAEGARSPSTHQLLASTVTTSGGLTAEGQVVGTPRYMSPEQIRGEQVDARTDLFSLGSVLYEMLTGERAFAGSTAVETEYAVLHAEPPKPKEELPPAVTQLLRHCLEKDRDKRFQSATDLVFHLDALRTPSGSVLAAHTRRKSWRWWWAFIPLAAGALIALAVEVRPIPQPQALPSVRRLTFRNGLVTAARFGPDRRTVFFSATWNGEPEQVYSTTTGNPDYHPLGVDDARLQTVSVAGELAVLLHPKTSNAGLSSVVGTLAIVPGVGGAPREVADDVTGASWSPDGLQMAITRQLAEGYRLEFPIGTPVYESRNPILQPRVAPGGGRIAFVERRHPDDSMGDLAVIEPGKAKRVLVKGLESMSDLAWTPAGDQIWFSALPAGQLGHPSLWAVSLHGDARLLYPGTLTLRLEDVGQDGRVLARDGQLTVDVGVINLASGTANVHLAWFDWPIVAGISADGRSLLLDEGGDAAVAFAVLSGGSPGSSAFLQKTDGSPAIRLGPGQPLGLSPDGKWALVFDLEKAGRLWLVPTGAGTRRSIDFEGLAFEPQRAHFSPDGRRAVLAVQRPEATKGYVVDFQSAQGRAITPPLREWGPTSPDGRYLAAVPVVGEPTAYPVDQGTEFALVGIQSEDRLLAWTRRGLLITPDMRPGKPARPTVRIFRVDPRSGARQLFTTLGPGEAPGADSIHSVFVTPDEKTMAYSYKRVTSRLLLFDFHPKGGTDPRRN
jgi:hypothetical protein